MASEHGFTLLEVLVALAVLGLALVTICGAISDSLLRTERVAQDEQATALANALLARIGYDLPLRIGLTDGEDGGLTWRMTVNPVKEKASEINVDEVTLTVQNKAGKPLGHWQALRVAPP